MDKDFLLCHMTERFRSLYGQVLDAIAGSSNARRDIMIEVAFHDALLELMRQSLRLAAQLDALSEWDADPVHHSTREPDHDGPPRAA